MLKKGIVSFVCVVGLALFFSPQVSAHTPLLIVEDNEDGTIYIEGGFSDGSTAAGTKILLVEKEKYKGDVEKLKKEGKKLYNKKLVLWQGKLDEDGCLEEVKKPEVPYLVIFDAGPGHAVEKEGPILTEEEKKAMEAEKKAMQEE